MFRNVLVGLSISPSWRHVLGEAIELAERHHGRLTILTAVPEPRAFAIGAIETHTAARDAADDLWTAGEALQRAALEQVPQCLPVATVLRRGAVWTTLDTELASGRHDSVVIGVSAQQRDMPLRRPPLSTKVSTRSPVPVIVVPLDRPMPRFRLTDLVAPQLRAA